MVGLITALAVVSLATFAGEPEPCTLLLQQARKMYVELVYLDASGLERVARASHEARRCLGDKLHKWTDDLYAWEAYALFRMERKFEAEAVLNEFFEKHTTHAPPSTLAYLHSLRADIRVRNGRFLEGLKDYRNAALHTGKDDLVGRARLALGLAVVYQRLKDFDKTSSALRTADSLLAKVSSEEPSVRWLRARVLGHSADVLMDRATLTGDTRPEPFRRAEYLAAQAAAAYAMAADQGSAIHEQSQVAAALGLQGRHAEALQKGRKALSLAEAYGDTTVLMKVVHALGRINIRAGFPGSARLLLSQAFELSKSVGMGHYTRRIAADLGLLEEATGNLSAADRWFRIAIEVTERQRDHLGTSEWSSVAFSYWEQPYRGLIRILASTGRNAEAFQTLEFISARRLRDVRRQATLLADLSPKHRAAADSLSRALSEVRSHLLASGAKDRDERTRLEAEELRLVTAYDQLFEHVVQPSARSLAEVQAILRSRRTTLLSYYIDDPDPAFKRPARSLVFVVTGSNLHVVPLRIERSTLVRMLDRVSPALAAGSDPASIHARQFDLHVLKQLHDELFAPVKSLLTGTRITIIPDGPLFRLPFAALVENSVGRFEYPAARFLIENYALSIELAASLLENQVEDESPSLDLLALGRSEFSSTADLPDALRSTVASLPNRLPAVEDEIRTICGLFTEDVCVLNSRAQEQTLFRLMTDARIVHIATHALPHASSPLHSALLLSPGIPSGETDGIVHAYELQRRSASPSLVVLSSCASARGVQRGGEGMISLQYAFRSMGTRSVLSTLWQADDATSSTLIQTFYRQLRAGTPRDVALQRAQLDYLRNAKGLRVSPFFWAAPTLYGKADPIPLRETEYRRWEDICTGALLLASIGSLYIIHRRRSRRRIAYAVLNG